MTLGDIDLECEVPPCRYRTVRRNGKAHVCRWNGGGTGTGGSIVSLCAHCRRCQVRDKPPPQKPRETPRDHPALKPTKPRTRRGIDPANVLENKPRRVPSFYPEALAGQFIEGPVETKWGTYRPPGLGETLLDYYVRCNVWGGKGAIAWIVGEKTNMRASTIQDKLHALHEERKTATD